MTFTTTTYPDMKQIISEITARLDVKEMANIVSDDIKNNIDKGLNADGSKMKPLSPATIEIKKKRGGISPSKPLIFKGGSQKGVKTQRVNSKEALVISTGFAKGYYGGGIGSTDMFKYQEKATRDPFGVSKRAVDLIVKYIKEKLGR